MLTHAKTGRVLSVDQDTVRIQVDQAELTWPRAAFHDVAQGDDVHVVVLKHTDLDTERNEVAKALLNSVLHPPHHEP